MTNDYFSIGEFCTTALQIRRCSGRQDAFLFDWLISPGTSFDFIASGNDAFLRPDNWEVDADGLRVRDRYSGLLFQHEFPATADHRIEAGKVDGHLSTAKAKFTYLKRKTIDAIRHSSRCVLVRSEDGLSTLEDAATRARQVAAAFKPINPDVRIVLASTRFASDHQCADFSAVKMATADRWEGDVPSWDRLFAMAEEMRFSRPVSGRGSRTDGDRPLNNAAVRWTPLTALASRFTANVDALAGRDPALADRLRRLVPAVPYSIAPQGDAIVLGSGTGADVRPTPCTLTPAQAAATAAQLFPDAVYSSAVLVAGEDLGWLWDRLYRLPCRSNIGHRPPLYLAIADLERLWALLHLHAWPDLLADPRVRLFAGPDAAAQLGRSMANDWAVGWPRRWVTIDPTVWPAGVTMDVLQARATAERERALGQLTAPATAAEAAGVVTRVAGGGPLRVLGYTSRYTSFLQHSMRDWLAAFEALGHEVRLVIEGADHEMSTPLTDAAACRDFRPDLIVVIDHYRRELPGLPAHVPVVMWVQDRLPNIFRPEAGAAQGPLDFCVGFGRLHLSSRYGYPAERFLPATVGVNDRRFEPRAATAAERAAFGCDVSYVGHASTPADVLLARQVRGAPPQFAAYMTHVYEQMRAHYEAGGQALHEPALRDLMHAAAAAVGTDVNAGPFEAVLEFFRQQVGNALYRQQALTWAAEAGVDLRLYGRGWENHPTLGRFARGEADNRDLPAICRASKINLQVTPFGSVHQRLLDGLAAGGFFLVRHSSGDAVGRPYQRLWAWCQRHGVTDDAAILAAAAADPDLRSLVRLINENEGFGDRPRSFGLYDVCAGHVDADFMVSADTVWDDYDRVAFSSRAELHALLNRYLRDDAGRAEVAARMRRAVADRVSYTAITGRLLDLIRAQLPAGTTALSRAA